MLNRPLNKSDTIALPADLFGYRLLADPRLNKGTAFTEEERATFLLHGLLPPTVVSIEEQAGRRLQAFREFHTDLERYAFLRDLQDTNETLYYALLGKNVEELLPIVYTPTVGAGCASFSRLFRKPRGVFLSIPHRKQIRQILSNPQFDKTEVIVVTDGERILGLGDQGAGGMGIPIGKLALYTACGGIDPATALPILLDVGTDNEANLNDPLYIGWRHKRVRGEEYDSFVAEFIDAVTERWPHVLLQWEDFAKANATRLLDTYRDRLCSFNDDIQGTAAVATGTLLAAVNVTGEPLTQQRIAILGGGSAGCGIANLLMAAMVDAGLDRAEAASRFYLVDKDGLLTDGMNDLAPFQKPFVQKREALAHWNLGNPSRVTLLDVIYNAKPTALIGVSAQAGAFTESVVRGMAHHNKRPIVFPLSNPVSCAEATPAEKLKEEYGKLQGRIGGMKKVAGAYTTDTSSVAWDAFAEGSSVRFVRVNTELDAGGRSAVYYAFTKDGKPMMVAHKGGAMVGWGENGDVLVNEKPGGGEVAAADAASMRETALKALAQAQEKVDAGKKK